MCFLPMLSQADVIRQSAHTAKVVIPDHAPARGMSQQYVIKKWGQPVEKHRAVGNPPISSWDYAGFSVYFERNLVLHSVATEK